MAAIWAWDMELGEYHTGSVHEVTLTSAEFAGESLYQLASLSKLLSEALPQIIVDIIASEKVFERFHGIFCMLGEKIADTSPFSYFLA